MGSSWFYTIVFLEHMLRQSDDVEQVVAVVATAGYSIKHPSTRLISMMTLDGMEALEFTDAAAAVLFLSEHGGYIDLWKNNISLGLIFVPASAPAISDWKDLPDQQTPSFAHVSISVDSFYFRDEATKWEVADDAQTLFTKLAAMPGAIYGYSVDEMVTEYIMEHMPPYREPYLPSSNVLFWLNFFPNEYVEHIGLARLQALGGTIVAAQRGVIVSLFRYPWDVDVQVWQHYHDRWQDLIR